MIYLGEMTADRTDTLTRFHATFGQDHWAHRTSGWILIGVNPASFDTDPGSAQVAWLSDALDGWAGPVGLFLHRPWFKVTDNAVTRDTRRGLEALFDAHDLRFVAQGHVQQLHDRLGGDSGIDWLPSIASVEVDTGTDATGARLAGLARLTLDPTGHRFDAGDTADHVVEFSRAPEVRELANA